MGDDTPIAELARGFRKRTLVTARLAAKIGLKALRKNLKIGGAARDVDDDKAMRAAGDLADKMGEMKGLIMKFGQMASYLEGSMPPAAQEVLSRLQAHSTPLTFDAASRVVIEELGGTPDSMFETFERQPFAAASLGQVHRARFGGRPVAVKVQYPGIANALDSDLKTVAAFARMGTMFSSVDSGALVGELRTRLSEECDYIAEAANQELFGRLLEAIEGARVPAVVGARTAKRVLTTELSSGVSFRAFQAGATQEAKDRAAKVIFETCMTTIFRHGLFNADPHPGNYLFEGDDVVFLDFGCIKRFPEDHIHWWKTLARCVLDGRRDGFEEACRGMGMVPGSRAFDWDHHWSMLRFLYEPFLTPGFVFTRDYVRRSYDVLLFDNANRYRMEVNPDMLFTNRLQWGLNSVLASLHARADWGGVMRRLVEAPMAPAPSGKTIGEEDR